MILSMLQSLFCTALTGATLASQSASLTTFTLKFISPTNFLVSLNKPSRSSVNIIVAICITANAAYPGSQTCLVLRMSLSRLSSRWLSCSAFGGWRYGGKGLLVEIADETVQRSEVAESEVGCSEARS